MSGYKVVPVEPTAEMVEAAASCVTKPDDLPPIGAGWTMSDLAFRTRYMAAIAAAPAVQGESLLVGYIRRSAIELMENDELGVRANIIKEPRYQDCVALYTAPQPAEEQPKLNLHLFAKRMDEELEKHDIQGFEPVLLAVAEEVLGYERPTEQHPAPPVAAPAAKFKLGDTVRKTKGSQWKGRVVGTYSTTLTPEGYAVESDTEEGSVQIYPVGALELVGEDVQKPAPDVDVLVEALEAALGSFDDWCEGQDPSDIADAIDTFPWVMQARTALAAHRKGGDA